MNYFFDAMGYEQFELGAKLIALLAFPGSKEIEVRHQAFEALCAQTVHATCAADPDNTASWCSRYPAYATIDEAEIRLRLWTLDRRLQDRMKAAQMALGYFDEALRHMFVSIGEAYPDLRPHVTDVKLRPTPLPDGVVRHSLNALVPFHYPRSNEEGWHNREQRVWRKSLPVIHLAAALHVLGRHLQPDGEGFAYKLDDPDLHRRALALAELHERAVDWEWQRRSARQKGSSAFVIDPDVLIRCRAERSATLTL